MWIIRKFLPPAAAVGSGLLLSLSFAPFDIGPIAWICLVPLFWAVYQVKSAWAAAALGFLTGMVFWITSIPWITNVIQQYTDMPQIAAFGLLALLSLYLSIYPMLVALLLRLHLSRSGPIAFFFAPVLWVAGELALTHLLTGFPWNLLGYSQVFFLPAIQVADLAGVYGVSFIIVLANAAIAFAAVKKPSLSASYVAPLAVTVLVLLAAFVYGFYKLATDADQEEKFKLTIVQDEFTNAERLVTNQSELFSHYIQSTREAAAKGSKVVFWGEGSLLFLDMTGKDDGPPTGFNEQYVLSLARDEGVWLIIGSNDYVEGEATLYNTAISIAPDNHGETAGRYAKVHLTPFGEYVPFKWIFGWLDKVVPEISDFQAGVYPTTMPLLNGRIGVAICYEIIFPDLVRQFAAAGATILSTISNDAWFGASSANDQHFNMAIMRAVENRRYLVRCAVTGVSGIVEPTGHVTLRTPTYTRLAVQGEAAMRRGPSIYTSYGDLFSYACVLLALFSLFRVRYTESR